MKKQFLVTAGFAVLLTLQGYSAEKLKPGDDINFIKKAALGVDQHIAAFYRKKKLPVPNVTDDATFLRRSFMVSIGRIPTAEEALAFLEIEDEEKRADLVGYLMGSPGYSSHMTNWAFDLLRLRDRKDSNYFTPYRNWIRESMRNNMPWDEFVATLLSSSGNGWKPENAAVGYYTIDRGMPLDNLATTMRIFLGASMECAQCHDDPFSETERMDFYRLAAFTEGQNTLSQDNFRKVYAEYAGNRVEDRGGFQTAKFIKDQIYGLSLAGGGAGKIELPNDYQYRDGTPGEFVGGQTPFGKRIKTSAGDDDDGDSRKIFSKWLTHETGPQFPGVIANRLWERVMGKGIYEPIDTYTKAEDTVYPELTKYITRLMVDLNYDMRAFQQILLLTKTFQFATNPNPSTLVGGDDFHGRKIERLTAEQVWDSLITLADGDPDKKAARSFDTRIKVGNHTVWVGEKDMIQLSEEFLALETEEEVRVYFDDFEKSVDDIRINGRKKIAPKSENVITTYRRDDPVRASELPSPAPRDHLLYVFGASNREVAEGASLEPNVGQILTMMNGFVQRKLVNNSGAYLYKSLEGSGSDEEKIRRLYVAILNRAPTAEEMIWMKEEVAVESFEGEGLQNIVSALVMSSEFLFLQ